MRSFSSFAARLCQEGSPKPSEALHVPVGKSAAFPLPPPEDERAQVPQEPRFLRHQKAYQLKQHYSIIFKYILMFCCSKTVLLFNNLPPVPSRSNALLLKSQSRGHDTPPPCHLLRRFAAGDSWISAGAPSAALAAVPPTHDWHRPRRSRPSPALQNGKVGKEGKTMKNMERR